MAKAAQKARENEIVDADTGEVTERHNAGDGVGQGGPVAMVQFGSARPSGFSVKRYVSVPMLEVPPGQSFVAQMVDAVRVLPPIEGQTRKIKGDHYASTIKAHNGEVRLFTWTTVFRSEMEKNYPEDGYVGKWFQITRLPIRKGKDYSTYSIAELEPEAA